MIQHIMIFENYPVEKELNSDDLSDDTKIRIANFRGEEQTNYDFNVVVMPGSEMEVQFQYNANVYDRVSVKRIGKHLIHLMHQMIQNPDSLIENLRLITDEEQK